MISLALCICKDQIIPVIASCIEFFFFHVKSSELCILHFYLALCILKMDLTRLK